MAPKPQYGKKKASDWILRTSKTPEALLNNIIYPAVVMQRRKKGYENRFKVSGVQLML